MLRSLLNFYYDWFQASRRNIKIPIGISITLEILIEFFIEISKITLHFPKNRLPKCNLQFCSILSVIIHISPISRSFEYFLYFSINDRELLIQRWQTQIFQHCKVNPQTHGILFGCKTIYIQLAPHILRDNNNIRLSLRFFSPRHDWLRIKRSPPVPKRSDATNVWSMQTIRFV